MERLTIFCLLVQMTINGYCQDNSGAVKTKSLTLNFENCLLLDKKYTQIQITLERGFKKRKVNDAHGDCEYRFHFPNGAVVYVTSNIYSGSYLNYENRLLYGIDTYARSRNLETADTLANTAPQTNGNIWSENILGDVVVGYVNVPLENKSSFDKVIRSIRRIHK